MAKRFLGLFAAALIAMTTAAPVLAQPAAPAPSARQIELANQVLDATGMGPNFDSNMKVMIGPMMQRLTANAKAQGKASDDTFNDAMLAVMTTLKPKVLAMMIKLYTETYSEEELTGILAFYRSPVGQSMLKKAPSMAGRMGLAMVELQPEMRNAVATEICKRIECPPGFPPTMAPGAQPAPATTPGL